MTFSAHAWENVSICMATAHSYKKTVTPTASESECVSVISSMQPRISTKALVPDKARKRDYKQQVYELQLQNLTFAASQKIDVNDLEKEYRQ